MRDRLQYISNVGEVRWLWSQDDAVPDEDTVTRAWRRLFGGEMPRESRSDGHWSTRLDLGDHEILRDMQGRVYCSSYPGANELGVVVGSPADAVPRLVISGGQTGADRGGLDAAIALGIPIDGAAPADFRAEDGVVPAIYARSMRETSSAGYDERTRDNVRDSDGTLILTFGELAGGSQKTMTVAERQRRPVLHVKIPREVMGVDGDISADAQAKVDLVAAWLLDHHVGVLNVAGRRESREPGLQARSSVFLIRAIAQARALAEMTHEIGGVGSADQVSSAEAPADRRRARVPDAIAPVVSAPSRATSGEQSWSPGQERALRAVGDWMRSPSGPQVFRLFGPAGTGKSTLVRHLVAQSSQPWIYAAYTGKAALVMQRMGCHGARTIHSLIYRPTGSGRDDDGELTFGLWDESPLREAPGVVLDECSMVDADMGRDLLSFRRKILVLADPAQLPPVRGGEFFTGGTPDVMLDEVHRQGRDSGILDLATHIRGGGDLSTRIGWSTDDCAVISRSRNLDVADLWRRISAADQAIVGVNRTRRQYNQRYRQLAGTTNLLPVTGDRVICLRNEHKTGLFNGSMWRVDAAAPRSDGKTVELDLTTEDGIWPSQITARSWVDHFLGRDMEDTGDYRRAYQEFDYAYFITCHKAQGSQWDDVVLFDESGSFRSGDARRWLYTGITRAAKRLLVVA